MAGAAAELQPARRGRTSTKATSRRSTANVTSACRSRARRLSVADLKETTRQFQALIADARSKGLTARAIGSRWSLSKAPTTTGWALNTNRLRGRMKIAAADLDAGLSRHGRPEGRPVPVPVRQHRRRREQGARERRTRSARCSPRAPPTARPSPAPPPAARTAPRSSSAPCTTISSPSISSPGDSHFWIERESRPVMSDAWVSAARRHAEARRRRSVQRRHGFVRQLRNHPRRRDRDRAALSAGDASPASPSSTRICGRRSARSISPPTRFFKAAGKPYFFQAVINPATDEVLLNANYRKDGPAGHSRNYDLTQRPQGDRAGLRRPVGGRHHPRRVPRR